ncbi:hypothetical protein J3R82DRAFT_7476 [Butyriboletus roseoflavus]|nr:hypothetical protein J3R82DRAFT_7476 [Butyriboletus roseoflavus]
MNSYPKERRNTVNRLNKRAAYDYETVHGIVNAASVVHVSFLPPSPSGSYDDPGERMPIILPMIGKMGVYPEGGDDAPACYLHGYVSSRLMKISSTVSASDAGESDGLPVCIAATHVDGLVLSLSPFSHSYNYRSAVLQGTATVVLDVDEKLWAMTLITNGVLPKRWETSRTPPTSAELQSTRILKVRIVSASAKVRADGPHDERLDVEDGELVKRVWTGVVPVFEGFGEPVPSTYNSVPTIPQDIREYLRRENVKRKSDAIRVATGGGQSVAE